MSNQSLPIENSSSTLFKNESSRIFNFNPSFTDLNHPQNLSKSVLNELQKRKHFMGGNVELVCLLQGAEIERLNSAIEQYRLKEYQISKIPLNIKSYEHQIKELVVQLNNKNNEKQVREEKYRQLSDRYQILEQKYKASLYNIEALMTDNKKLQSEINQLNLVIHRLKKQKDLKEKQSQKELQNFSLVKSNVEIEILNLSNSISILEVEKNNLNHQNSRLAVLINQRDKITRDYQDKLALIAQEVSRLTNMNSELIKQNELMKLKLRQISERMIRFDNDNNQLRSVIERNRYDHSQIKNSLDDRNNQIRAFTQKIAYLQTIIKDQKSKVMVLNNALNEKNERISEIEEKFREMENVRIKENYSSKQLIEEINHLKKTINDISENYRFLQRQKNELISLKGQNEAFIKKLELEKRQLGQKIEQFGYQLKQKGNSVQLIEQKFENKVKQLHWQLQKFNNEKTNQISKHITIINQLKSQLNLRNTQVSSLKMELVKTNSQSTILESTKRDYESNMKQISQRMNQHTQKNHQLQELIQKLIYEKDNLQKQKEQLKRGQDQKGQALQRKNIEINQFKQNIYILEQKLKEYQYSQNLTKSSKTDLQNILKSKEATINQYSIRQKDLEKRIRHLTDELERISIMFKQKENHIFQLSSSMQNKIHQLEERELQIKQLKEIKQRMQTNLNSNQQSKGNFSLFMNEIERLNQVSLEKEINIKNLQKYIVGLTKKIDDIHAEQNKLLRMIEISINTDSKRQDKLDRRFEQLKAYLDTLNKKTSSTLEQVSSNSQTVNDYIIKLGIENNAHLSALKQKVALSELDIKSKSQQIQTLLAQINELKFVIADYDKKLINQNEVVEKMLTFTRENTVLKQKLINVQNAHEVETNKLKQVIYKLEQKNTVTTNQSLNKQSQQLLKLKQMIESQNKKIENQYIKTKAENEKHIQRLFQLEKQNNDHIRRQQLLLSQNQQLKNQIEQVSRQIDKKLSQFNEIQRAITLNNSQMSKYKQTFNLHKIQQSQIKEKEHHLEEYKRQLEEIIQIRNIQHAQNFKQYQLLKVNYEQQQIQINKLLLVEQQFNQKESQYLQMSYKYQQVLQQLQGKEENIKNSEAAIAILEKQLRQAQSTSKNTIKRQSELLTEINSLKRTNAQLLKQSDKFKTQLAASNKRLQFLSNEIAQLKSTMMNTTKQLGNCINHIEVMDNQIEGNNILKEKILQLSTLLQNQISLKRQYEIENNYLQGERKKNIIDLERYELKTNQLSNEYDQFSNVISNLRTENAKLKTKNHMIQIQLKKAEIHQQKIKILNSEINRLSSQNINLTQEVSSCKFALGEQFSSQKRYEQQLILLTLLFAEIESLRQRLRNQQNQNKTVRNLHLSKYRY